LQLCLFNISTGHLDTLGIIHEFQFIAVTWTFEIKREAYPLLPFSQQIISCLYISCCHKSLCHCPLFHHPNRVLCCLLTVISRLRHHVITIWATWTISMKAIFNHCFLHVESGLFNFRWETIPIIVKHPHGI